MFLIMNFMFISVCTVQRDTQCTEAVYHQGQNCFFFFICDSAPNLFTFSPPCYPCPLVSLLAPPPAGQTKTTEKNMIYSLNWCSHISSCAFTLSNERKPCQIITAGAYWLRLLQRFWMLSVRHGIQKIVCQFVHVLVWFGQELWADRQTFATAARWKSESLCLTHCETDIFIHLKTK